MVMKSYYLCFVTFESGNEYVEDEQRHSRPETDTNEGIKQYIGQSSAMNQPLKIAFIQ